MKANFNTSLLEILGGRRNSQEKEITITQKSRGKGVVKCKIKQNKLNYNNIKIWAMDRNQRDY